MLNTPVLLIIFNRPTLTAQVFDAIRKAKPSQLFIAADGPRNEAEQALTQATRLVTEYIDWPCKVHRHYADANMGCKMRPYSAINWAFDTVEELIILEDDCLPHPDFFGFCSQLLNKYKDDNRVMHISGDCFLPYSMIESYYFTKFTHVWGWATTVQSWRKMDIGMTDWDLIRKTDFLKKILGNKSAAKYWTTLFDSVAFGDPKIWDYQWTYSVWKAGGLAISPTVNLVSNIGFGKDATHTQNLESELAKRRIDSHKITVHPKSVVVNDVADSWIFNHIYYSPPPPLWRRILKKLKG